MTTTSDLTRSIDVDDFFLARHPVTCGEWAAFLNELGSVNPAEPARRVPIHHQTGKSYWPLLPGGRTIVPTADWVAANREAAAACAALPV